MSEYDPQEIVHNYINKLEKELIGIKIEGYNFLVEIPTGCWCWNKKDGEYTIYATLGWEGLNELPIDINNQDGDIINLTDENCTVHNLTFDLERDVKTYVNAVRNSIVNLNKEQ